MYLAVSFKNEKSKLKKILGNAAAKSNIHHTKAYIDSQILMSIIFFIFIPFLPDKDMFYYKISNINTHNKELRRRYSFHGLLCR
jgi:hypothetical protein